MVTALPFLSGMQLNLAISLHNQGVLEQEHVILVQVDDWQPSYTSPTRSASKKRTATKSHVSSEVSLLGLNSQYCIPLARSLYTPECKSTCAHAVSKTTAHTTPMI